ncbi:MAG TPA: hypothetical protein VL181_03050 [Holophagaceae bacterium]|nr:hypothetical protein [Holophagaceae bacterium]
MGARFWIKRFLAVYATAFLILAISEWIKGHGWRGGRVFSAEWALITASVFIGTRLYYSSQGVACAICKDTPE